MRDRNVTDTNSVLVLKIHEKFKIQVVHFIPRSTGVQYRIGWLLYPRVTTQGWTFVVVERINFAEVSKEDLKMSL